MSPSHYFSRKRQRLANLLGIGSTGAQGGIWQRHLEHRRVEKEQGGRKGGRTTEPQMSRSPPWKERRPQQEAGVRT